MGGGEEDDEVVEADVANVEGVVEGDVVVLVVVVVADKFTFLSTYMKNSRTVWLNQQNQGLSPATPYS